MKNPGKQYYEKCSFVCLAVSMCIVRRKIILVGNIPRNRIVCKYYLTFPHWQIRQSSLLLSMP